MCEDWHIPNVDEYGTYHVYIQACRQIQESLVRFQQEKIL